MLVFTTTSKTDDDEWSCTFVVSENFLIQVIYIDDVIDGVTRSPVSAFTNAKLFEHLSAPGAAGDEYAVEVRFIVSH